MRKHRPGRRRARLDLLIPLACAAVGAPQPGAAQTLPHDPPQRPESAVGVGAMQVDDTTASLRAGRARRADDGIAGGASASAALGFLDREQVDEALRRAARAFIGGDYRRAVALIEGRRHAIAGNAEALNLLGAAYSELTRQRKAREAFSAALDLQPDHFWAAYNLAELDFVEGRSAQARGKFLELKSRHPAMSELLDLKLVLTHLAEDDIAAAREVAVAMPFPCDTPSWYVARAALDLHTGDSDSAYRWLAESERVMPGGINEFLLRTLRDAELDIDTDRVAAVPKPRLPTAPLTPEQSARRSGRLPLDLRADDLTLEPARRAR